MCIRDRSHVDHTLLKPEATWPQIQQLCDEAIANHTASVCINTCYVKQAVEYMACLLYTSGIDPATKANQITREQKRELVQLIKHWRVTIDARGDVYKRQSLHCPSSPSCRS